MSKASLGIYLHVDGLEAFDKALDFDKVQVRKAMQRIGRLVQRDAQKRVNGALADYPYKRSGTLRRSIKYRVSRPGFLVKIAPHKASSMAAFYPAFLYYGVKRGAKRNKGHRKQSDNGRGWRIKPRGNYMVDALHEKSGEIRRVLGAAIRGAFKY